MDLPAPVAPALVSRRRRRRRFWLVVGVLLALFILFEAGIRLVPPDGMTFTEYDIQNHWDHHGHELPATTSAWTMTFTGPKDQSLIDTYYHALNNGQSASPYPGGGGCVTVSGETDYKYVFTWRGVPLQSWSGGPCAVFTPSSGGIPYIVVWHSIGLPPPPQSR